MPRRPIRRNLSRNQPCAFSPFMRSLALASTARRRLASSKAAQSWEEMLPSDENVSNTSNEGNDEQLSESSDEDDSQGVVQADFEFFDPKPEDFHGIKTLLQNYLDDKEWDLSSFVDLIAEQTTVGTVIKVAEDEDEALFALVTALNLGRYKENKCFRELKEFLLKVSPENNINISNDLKLLLEKKAQDVGLLVSQRVTNLPPQLLPPLYDGLFDEISWATEDEPTEELRKSFQFKSYILLTKIYKLKNAKNRKIRHGEEGEETIFCKPEDELFLELSSWSFTFAMNSQPVTSRELKDYQLMGLVMEVKADRIPEFRQKLTSLIDEQ